MLVFSNSEMGPKISLFFSDEESGTSANDMACPTLPDKYLFRWERHVRREGAGQAAKSDFCEGFNWSKAGRLTKNLEKEKYKMLC